MMNKQLKAKFPTWVNEVNSDNKLILTNDLDSLFSSLVLKQLFGCEIGMFYDFTDMYSVEKKFDRDKVIGIDLAIEQNVKTFCNHVTRIAQDDKVNPLSANLNNICGIYGGLNSNYFNKYAGSTLLLILSLYDCFDGLLLEGHTKLTETQLKILVSVDSYFLGYHFNGGHVFRQWQQMLGLEMFKPILEKYSVAEFNQFQKDNHLKESIFVDDTGRLNTYLDIAFLKEHFPMLDWNVSLDLKSKTELKTFEQDYHAHTSKQDLGSVFSLAVTSRKKVKYTIL